MTKDQEALSLLLDEKRIIDGNEVEWDFQEITSCNILGVEVGSNVGEGAEGDSGYGYRTYLRIKDLASTDMRLVVKESALNHRCTTLDDGRIEFEIDDIEIRLGGTTENETFIEALRFAYKYLINKKIVKKQNIQLLRQKHN